MRMKVGSYIFATLTFGALTNASLAGNHHRYGHHGTGAASVQQDPGPVLQAVPLGTGDTPNGGSEGSGPHVKTDAKTGEPPEGETDKTLVRGNHGTPPTGDGNEDRTGSPIDTSITVYQRRERGAHKDPLKDLKMRLGIKSNTSVTPGTVAVPGTVVAGTDHPRAHAHNHHQAPALRANNKGGQTRNAIGALVDRAKTGDHRATGPAGTGGPAPNAGVAPPVPAPQISGATGREPKPAAGPMTPNKAGPAATHIVGPVTANALSIGGTVVIHPGSGPGVIGGPAKNLAGINGTGFQIKHR
jgi:hypothetical protein